MFPNHLQDCQPDERVPDERTSGRSAEAIRHRGAPSHEEDPGQAATEMRELVKPNIS